MSATLCRPRYPGRPRRRPNQREHGEQSAVFAWARGVAAMDLASPLRWLFATQNGLRTSLLQAVMAKRAGLTAGVPDMILPYRGRGYSACWIELKAPPTWDTAGKELTAAGALTDEQRAWLGHLNGETGHYATTCYGADAAIACLRWYLGEDQDAVTRALGVTLEFPREGGSRWKPARPARRKT